MGPLAEYATDAMTSQDAQEPGAGARGPQDAAVAAGTGDDFDAKAVRMVKLINDLDGAIRAVRRLVPPAKPWQRALLAKVADADRRMQVLRMMEAMDKSDGMIAEATVDLASACRAVALAVQGSRADAIVRSGATSIAKLAEALTRLVLEAVQDYAEGNPAQTR